MSEYAVVARLEMLEALLLRAPMYVGLARSGVEDEETDPNYGRQIIAFGPASEIGGVLVLSNALEIRFPRYLTDAKALVKWWFVTREPAGDVGGAWLARGQFSRGRRFVAGDAPIFYPGDLELGLK